MDPVRDISPQFVYRIPAFLPQPHHTVVRLGADIPVCPVTDKGRMFLLNGTGIGRIGKINIHQICRRRFPNQQFFLFSQFIFVPDPSLAVQDQGLYPDPFFQESHNMNSNETDYDPPQRDHGDHQEKDHPTLICHMALPSTSTPRKLPPGIEGLQSA